MQAGFADSLLRWLCISGIAFSGLQVPRSECADSKGFESRSPGLDGGIWLAARPGIVSLLTRSADSSFSNGDPFSFFKKNFDISWHVAPTSLHT